MLQDKLYFETFLLKLILCIYIKLIYKDNK
jgi:hypothetical protein